MEILKLIRKPIEDELGQYRKIFDSYFVQDNALLQSALNVVVSRQGKMMRPILTLLSAKLLGTINDNTIHSACAFEFFHTASLLHDDIVDESEERRGQASINSSFGNKVAVLVGDFILANSLISASLTGSSRLVAIISEAAQRLAKGELLQLSNVQNTDFSEQVYFDIICGKTAALFAACGEGGALSVSADEEKVQILRQFGEIVGICFQIRDDIFDYNNDASIGKPTGNDMKEGKLTLPVLHVLNSVNDEYMNLLARKVKSGNVSQQEIAQLVDFTKSNGGIEYAVSVMHSYADKAKSLLDIFDDSDVKQALNLYIDFVVGRSY